MNIYLCSRFEVLKLASEIEATHLISLLDPREDAPVPGWIDFGCILRIDCHDIHTAVERYVAPTLEHAQSIIGFARNLPDDASLIVHCHAGVSRSPAAVILCLAATAPSFGKAAADVRRFFEAQSFIRPNPLLVRHGDEVLGLEGRLVRLVQDLQGEQFVRIDASRTTMILP